MSITMDMTYGGKPIEALNQLIARRQRVFGGELTKQTVAAVTIVALKSIRARTRKGKGKVIVR